MPGVLSKDSPGICIALKVFDGDSCSRVRPAVILELLNQLKALNEDELIELREFGPRLPVKNWRDLIVGKSYPTFHI
jgi:L-asparaginase II